MVIDKMIEIETEMSQPCDEPCKDVYDCESCRSHHKHLVECLEELKKYRAIGTVEEIKANMEEVKRWHTDKTNPKIKNVFANTSTLICHSCDYKDDYIEDLEDYIGKLESKIELDKNKVAMLTGVAIQDDETFKSEGGFIPERDQYYFEMKQGDNVFLVGFKDLLISLRLLEKMGEIPEIGDKWWLQMATLYGNDILMVEFTETE